MHGLSNRRGLRCLTLLAMIWVTAGCSRPFPDGLDPYLLSAIAAGTPTTPDARKFIFVTVGTNNGNLGGVSGADGICAAEKTTNFPALPGAATEYDALLTDGAARVACTTANCGTGAGEHTDWVLAANTNYYRSDEQLLFQTNGDGIFVFGTLTNAFSTNAADYWWTGMDVDWTAVLHCLAWTDPGGGPGPTGFKGKGNEAGPISISDFDHDCAIATHLLCVRR